MVHEGASSQSAAARDSPKAALSTAFDGITIKQEKITPPSSPSRLALNGTYLSPAAGGDDKGVQKSSSEILGELFQVFAADIPDDLIKRAGSKKKHKKEKKAKKSSRHKERNGADGPVDAAENVGSDEKKKHRHTERDRKHVTETEKEDPLTAKLNERKRRFEGNAETIKGIAKIPKSEEPTSAPTNTTTAAAAAATSTKPGARKIVFKNLKDSAILNNAQPLPATSSSERNRSDKHHADNDGLSDLSLSDEETYMRERNTFYRKTTRRENPFYASQTKVPEDDEPVRSSSSLSILSSSSQDTKEAATKPSSAESDSWRNRGKFREFRRDESPTENVSDPEGIDEEEKERRPFQAKKLKNTKEPIVMNIRNAVAIPPKTAEHKAEILAQLSGHQNRRNESEWMAIEKKAPAPKVVTKPPVVTPAIPPPNMALPPPVLLNVTSLQPAATPTPHPVPPPAPAPSQPPRKPNVHTNFPQLYSSFVSSKKPAIDQNAQNLPHQTDNASVSFGVHQPFTDTHYPPQYNLLANPPPIVAPPIIIPPSNELPTTLNFPPPPIQLVRQQLQKQQQEQSQRSRHNPFATTNNAPLNAAPNREPPSHRDAPTNQFNPQLRPHPQSHLHQPNDDTIRRGAPRENSFDRPHFDEPPFDEPPFDFPPRPDHFAPPLHPEDDDFHGPPRPRLPKLHELPPYHQQRILQRMHEDRMLMRERFPFDEFDDDDFPLPRGHYPEDMDDEEFDRPRPHFEGPPQRRPMGHHPPRHNQPPGPPRFHPTQMATNQFDGPNQPGPPTQNHPRFQSPQAGANRFGGLNQPEPLQHPTRFQPPHQSSNRFIGPNQPGPTHQQQNNRFAEPNQPGRPPRFQQPPQPQAPNRFGAPSSNPFAKPNPFANAAPQFGRPMSPGYPQDRRFGSPNPMAQQNFPPSRESQPIGPMRPPFGDEVADTGHSIDPSIVEQRLNAIRNLHDQHHQEPNANNAHDAPPAVMGHGGDVNNDFGGVTPARFHNNGHNKKNGSRGGRFKKNFSNRGNRGWHQGPDGM